MGLSFEEILVGVALDVESSYHLALILGAEVLMSGDDAHDKASAAAFEALFAAAEECVERIENKRTDSDPLTPEDGPVHAEESATTDQDPVIEAAPHSGAAIPPPRHTPDSGAAIPPPRHAPDSGAAIPPPRHAPRAPTPAMTAKPSADGAVTLSLIKARDELGHLLAQEKKQVAQLTAENQRLSHRVDKFKAGRDSVRERGQREREAALDAARDKLLKEFLPVLDNLERALDVELGESADELGAKVSGLLTGVEGVVQMFKSSLQKFGVTGFDSVGHPFDPNLHEAIRRVEDASVPNNHVVEEYHRGYLMGERLLRASLVVVATGGPRSDG